MSNKKLVVCVKCGNPTDGQYRAFDKPLCKVCASWFGYMMIKMRNKLSEETNAI